jgi:hypothetical protein
LSAAARKMREHPATHSPPKVLRVMLAAVRKGGGRVLLFALGLY